MKMRLIIGLCTFALLAAGCASGGSSGTSSSGTASTPRPRGNANLITEEEIRATGLETVFEVVERLRPNMLRTRGQVGRISGASGSDPGASSSTIKVYYNGSQIGDISALRGIQAASVKQIQYLNASDATTRFGTGVDAGAIIVTSR